MKQKSTKMLDNILYICYNFKYKKRYMSFFRVNVGYGFDISIQLGHSAPQCVGCLFDNKQAIIFKTG